MYIYIVQCTLSTVHRFCPSITCTCTCIHVHVHVYMYIYAIQRLLTVQCATLAVKEHAVHVNYATCKCTLVHMY